MVRRWLVVIAVTIVGVGCDDPVLVEDGDFTVTAGSDAFVVRNRSETLQSVHAIVEIRASALIDLVSCDEWTPRLPPGEEEVVLYEDVIGYAEDAETALVYWCMFNDDEPVDGGSLTVPFR